MPFQIAKIAKVEGSSKIDSASSSMIGFLYQLSASRLRARGLSGVIG